MNVFADELDALAGKLVAAGLPAGRDPAANPPMVLLDGLRLDRFTLGMWGGSYTVKLIAPPPGDRDAETMLLDWLETTLRTLGPPTRAERATVLNGAGREMPAYVIQYPIEVSNPDC